MGTKQPRYCVWVYEPHAFRYKPLSLRSVTLRTAQRHAENTRLSIGYKRDAVIVLPGEPDRAQPNGDEVVAGGKLAWGEHPDPYAYYGITGINLDLAGLAGWQLYLRRRFPAQCDDTKLYNTPPTWW